VTGAQQSPPSSLRIDFYIRIDFHIRVEADIREMATRYGPSEDLIAAVIEAESEFNPRAVSCRRGPRAHATHVAAFLAIEGRTTVTHLPRTETVADVKAPLRARLWGLGWRVVLSVLVPFGWLALVFPSSTASIWFKHLEREYLVWRWRRSYEAKAIAGRMPAQRLRRRTCRARRQRELEGRPILTGCRSCRRKVDDEPPAHSRCRS